MTEIGNLFDYIYNTPTNTNKRVLKQMVNNLVKTSGNNGIEKVDELPTIEEGKVVFVKTNSSKETYVFSDLLKDFAETAAKEEEEENWVTLSYKLYAKDIGIEIESLTQEQKEEAREKFISNICEENLESLPTYFSFKISDSPNLSFLKLENFIDIENPVFDDERKIYHLNNDLLFGGIEKSDDLDCFELKIAVIADHFETFENHSDQFYTPYLDGYLEVEFPIVRAGAETSLTLFHGSAFNEFDGQDAPSLEKYFIYNQETDTTSIYLSSCFFKENGVYSMYSDYFDNVSFSELTVTNPGWYGFVVKFPGVYTLQDLLDGKEISSTLSIEKILFLEREGTKINALDTSPSKMIKIGALKVFEDGEITSFFDTIGEFAKYQDKGLFVCQEGNWQKISLENYVDSYSDLFSILSHEYDFDKYSMSIVADASSNNPITFNSDTNILSIKGIRLKENGSFDKKWSNEINLSSLKGEDLRIRRIERYSNGDNDQDDGIIHTCYRAFYTNGNSIGGEESYFDFYVDIPKVKEEEVIDPNTYLRKIYFSNYPLSSFSNYEQQKHSIRNIYSLESLATEMQIETDFSDLYLFDISSETDYPYANSDAYYMFIQQRFEDTEAQNFVVSNFSEIALASKSKLDSLEARIAALEGNT